MVQCQCPVLVKTTYKEIIPSSSMKQRVHLVHDCLSGECGFEESNHDVVEEREVINLQRVCCHRHCDRSVDIKLQRVCCRADAGKYRQAATSRANASDRGLGGNNSCAA
ncbi:Hypothetical predicted protein [Paramuricea clavata]|uniref:Uncharacterized protein n=1 Tax=Paramuricea clavata TaxID=317549 RepID=A0A6S7G2G1_PARCT|nr:Hypothetical predicted protein [Paramuricea clavata]